MKSNDMLVNSRRTAAFAILRALQTKDYAASLLPGTGPDRAFVQDLVFTTIRRLRPLRKILGLLLKTWPKGELEALLYVGAAQILYMPDVPDFAAVNETVNAARLCPNPNVARVVNGVLRNLIRRRTEFEALLAAAPVDERESFPRVLYRRWVERFGAADAERLAVWHNAPAKTFLAYPDRFEELPRGCRVTDAEGFAEGRFIVQDPATHLAIEALDVHPGESILDACAAPGGKTIQIAWRGADVTACEVNPRRRRTLEENLRRTKQDVKVFASFADCAAAQAAYDKILVDAPCSNTGVLRRRPDARWNWSEEKLASLVRLQSEILDQVAPLLAPGGRLVYSTCSNEPEENNRQTAAFVERHPTFEILSENESIPFQSDHDGAYAAILANAS